MVLNPSPHTPCAVDRSMNDHGALTLSETTGSRTYQVVEYATAEIRETLALASDGTTVRVWLEPLNSRGDAWRAVDVDGGVDMSHRLLETMKQPASH